MSVFVQHEDFDAGAEMAALAGAHRGIGAVASFVGYVRADGEPGQDATVRAMTLEHYPGMTEQALAAIVGEANDRWRLDGVRVIHRVGRLLPGAQIVFVGVASAHRGDAFAACAFIMDYLKTRAPFWKKEETDDGARWVDARETDDAAAARWQTDQSPSAEGAASEKR